jgi:hypothetical protein
VHQLEDSGLRIRSSMHVANECSSSQQGSDQLLRLHIALGVALELVFSLGLTDGGVGPIVAVRIRVHDQSSPNRHEIWKHLKPKSPPGRRRTVWRGAERIGREAHGRSSPMIMIATWCRDVEVCCPTGSASLTPPNPAVLTRVQIAGALSSVQSLRPTKSPE